MIFRSALILTKQHYYDNFETAFGFDASSVGPFILVGTANAVVFVLAGLLLIIEKAKGTPQPT